MRAGSVIAIVLISSILAIVVFMTSRTKKETVSPADREHEQMLRSATETQLTAFLGRPLTEFEKREIVFERRDGKLSGAHLTGTLAATVKARQHELDARPRPPSRAASQPALQ